MKGGKNMRKKLIAAMMAGVLSAGMFSTGVFAADTDLKGEVNTFIAASLSNAMEEIQKDFNETYPDVEILYNADSSGTLQTQIEEGARCDIFFSAADKQMNALVDENLAKKDTVEDILENSVPVGQYAREIFDNLGITDEVNKMEINEGKNVSEVLAAVSEGSNEIGIVYATDAASVADKVDVIAEAPADALKTPVLYPVGLIEDKEASEDDTAAAEAFLEYIKSDDAMKVFEKYGFTAYKADDASETDDKDAEATETNAETETTEEAK